MNTRSCPRSEAQRGATAVEFALVSLFILFPLLFATIELGRVVFYWNAATEVTRLGARLAVVCDLDDGTIKQRMTALFPVIDAASIDIDYEPAGCTTTSCSAVRVSVLPLDVSTYIPDFLGTRQSALIFKFPPFSTSLPRESMRSAMAGASGVEFQNPVCL
ncbi:TadE/TadG family type IV pilus assembly protein [Massilia litorea]|uniref:Pilus assembly protein n=1 Tax=Massilia litorea TaxID=2769491 RepID=A0A7L9UCB6_9BURK|nr:TadE family protein [Massilia litorea]QOL51766.1 pilus assembly protein [Massilia litorea]